MKLKQTIALLVFGIALAAAPNLALADTTYQVPVSMQKADNPSKMSVANNALNQTAQVVVKDNGTSEYTISFHAMEMNGMKGNVTNLFLADAGKKEVSLVAKGDEKSATFTRDKAKETDIKLAFWVDAMDSLMGGTPGAGEQEALLHMNWAAAKEVNASTPGGSSDAVSTPQGNDPIQVFINGKKVAFDTMPVIQNNRTLVPVRAIFEGLGAEVKWNGATNTVSSTKGSQSLSLVIGSTNAVVDGKNVQLDVPASIMNSRTMVPLRFIGEAYGNKVDYNRVGGVAVIDIRG